MGLQLERHENVLRITIDEPPVNALSRALLESLAEAVERVAADPSVSVLHLRGAGRAFCAGANLDEMRAGFADAEGLEGQLAFVRRLQQVFDQIERLDAVSVAEIGGHALGGGLELALACDLRIGALEARIGLPEVALGLVPGAGGTQRLARLCGPALARRLILGAETLDGRTAEQIGLLHWAAPKAELPAQAQALVARLAELPRAALAEAKACIDCATRPDNEGFEHELVSTRRLMTDAETRRRVAAFLAR
ncbi:MAG TPA: enoyl-CoA hydratase/isomerase family protein [Zeimonas sp.]|nr:enoyl-CoA hydratase/isomerase family protein [Zeimonas sp.]